MTLFPPSSARAPSSLSRSYARLSIIHSSAIIGFPSSDDHGLDDSAHTVHLVLVHAHYLFLYSESVLHLFIYHILLFS